MKILGIDIGGSGIKGAVVDTKKGKLLTKRKRFKTPQPATPEDMLNTVVQLVEHFEWKGIIGCGFPAAVQRDIVRTASNIDKTWIGLNAAEEITKRTNCPTHVLNDVDAAGLAEMKFGAGKKQEGVTIVLAAGTGIGSAIFIDKDLVPNMELGFIHVNGMPGEHYAANSVRENEKLSWEEWGGRFNEYLQRLESLFWPDLFILGGGVSKDYNEYKKYFNVNTKIVPAKTKNHAGIIGAALAAKVKFRS